MTADNALPAGQAKASNLATLIGSAVAVRRTIQTIGV